MRTAFWKLQWNLKQLICVKCLYRLLAYKSEFVTLQRHAIYLIVHTPSSTLDARFRGNLFFVCDFDTGLLSPSDFLPAFCDFDLVFERFIFLLLAVEAFSPSSSAAKSITSGIFEISWPFAFCRYYNKRRDLRIKIQPNQIQQKWKLAWS